MRRGSALSISGRDLLIAVVLLVFAASQFLATVDDKPLDRDEARWIHRTVYLRELTHPFSSYWDEATWRRRGASLDERNRLRAQPPMASYLLGFGLLVQGRDLATNGYWLMERDEVWNSERGNAPEVADLAAARRTVAIVAALTVVVAYALGTRLTNRIGGLATALFVALHPLVGLYAAFAGSDMLLVLLVALTAIAAGRLADRPTWPRALLLGALIGLGGATKLSPLLVAVPLALLGGMALVAGVIGTRLWNATALSPPPPGFAWQLLSVPLVAGSIFVGSYPYLWSNPVANTQAMFDFRRMGMELQGKTWDHLAVPYPVDAFRRVGIRLGDHWTVLGRVSTELDARFGVIWDTRGIELALGAAGGVMLLALVIRSGLWSGHALVATVLVSQATITVLGLRADFARYHLPVLLLVAVSLGVLAGCAWDGLRQLRSVHAPAPADDAPPSVTINPQPSSSLH